MSVKEIFLTEKHTDVDFLGKFLDESNYDTLVTEDCDVYKPSSFGDPRDESNVLLKFRKGYFQMEHCKEAYAGFKDGATASHNRGIAAGTITDAVQKQNPDSAKGRGWVTEYHMAILNYFMQPSAIKLFNDNPDTLAMVRARYEASRNKVSGTKDPLAFGRGGNSERGADGLRGYIWLEEKLKSNNFDFDRWADEVALKSKDDQISEARWVFEELISGTNYATPVFSGVAGYYDRYPRIPYCRATSYTAYQMDKFARGIPFIEELSQAFNDLMPVRFSNQKTAIEKIDRDYRIGDSAYTTLTINKNFRTAVHTDAGDLESGFGNLTALSENGWEGGFLCFPEFRVAVDIRPGDMLLMDVHELHGNTPITGVGDKPADRISLVAYFRENMLNCSAKKYEDLRYEFVEKCKNNKDLPFWRENFNGVFPNMFSSEYWYDYIRLRYGDEFLRDHHPEAFEITLDAFFEEA